MEWLNGDLLHANIYSERGGEVKLKYGGRVQQITLGSGETYIFFPNK